MKSFSLSDLIEMGVTRGIRSLFDAHTELIFAREQVQEAILAALCEAGTLTETPSNMYLWRPKYIPNEVWLIYFNEQFPTGNYELQLQEYSTLHYTNFESFIQGFLHDKR